MAKKTQTTVIEEEDKDLHTLITEANTPQEEPKPEAPVVPEPNPEPVTETVIDENKLKQELQESLKSEISEEVTDRIVRSLTGKSVDENKDTEGLPPWEVEKRNPYNYTEIANWAKDQAKNELSAEIEADEKKVADQKAAQEAQAKQNSDLWGKVWDNELKDLETAGKIPPIENAEDPNDPGKKARAAIFTKMFEVNQERNKEGRPITMSTKEIYYEHYQDPNQAPPGATAPVYTQQKTNSSSEGSNFSYDEMHNDKNWFKKVLSTIKR